MRFISYRSSGAEGLAVAAADGYRGLSTAALGADLKALMARGPDALLRAAAQLAGGEVIDLGQVTLLPPIPSPDKIICIGLNYADHSKESGFEPPAYPTVFARYATSLVAHGAPIIRPGCSEQLDYEGELAVIIGRGGRHIREEDALDHVGGYSVFNDGSIRDYQFKSPQWTVGKTFDATGGFGPELVSPDELPPGCKGLRLETRLNGEVVQSASTDDLIFDVARLIAILSEAITLAPGDVIVSGTPAGVGLARKPPLWMKPGDVCEVAVERVGRLINPIGEETASAAWPAAHEAQGR
ncbi:MAG: fumarylacetoacetate hydrolase family protein [Phenylobacterium sp.]|uniref:fumarylacetoacetate hydrolase family protein n=1 Tax=Phenylobacterium sp. TaxID=1871053 RepID=UPI002735BED5|nr:fumarylacetoacetate hydrolase family protein [Phenylobacterium sp.]MDP3747681.1 fumarylacetoacetate hydrolase family protein [Phenylobacterium sp.]